MLYRKKQEQKKKQNKKETKQNDEPLFQSVMFIV